MIRTIFHTAANSAYLSWTAAAMLEKGYPFEIREIPSVISGDPLSRHANGSINAVQGGTNDSDFIMMGGYRQ